jgi:hypothetical protein
MSGVKLKEWVVEFDLDFIDRTFVVKHVIDITGKDYPPHKMYPYTFIDAMDELSAFGSAARRIEALGFESRRA